MQKTNVTLLSDDAETSLSAEVSGDEIWITAPDLERAVGWKVTPDGFCRGSVCIPIPRDREAELTRPDGRANLAGFARLRGQAIVHSDDASVWALDAATSARSSAQASLEAPDFTLPDLGGRLHSLHEHRGRKVLLASWASW